MFQFTGLSSLELCIHSRILDESSRFPHSEIPGSKITYISPRHIVVCHVLHRLLMPRHPPCALINLTYFTPISSYLMMSFEILMSFLKDRNDYSKLHYLVFKEQNLRE